MSGYLYILESEQDHSLYLGSTNNLENRLRRHNNGETTSTSRKIPWKIIFARQFADVSAARSLEQKLKRIKRKWAIEWVSEWIEKNTREI